MSARTLTARTAILVLVLASAYAAAHDQHATTSAASSGFVYSSRQQAPACTAAALVEERFDNGAAWSLCWSSRQREGLVVEGLTYTAPEREPFTVLASGQLAQLHVAYDDSAITYNDITEFGLGGSSSTDLTAEDCPDGDLLFADERSIACLRRLSDTSYGDATVRQRIELYAISQVGAYTYLVTWRLHDDGSIEPVVGASGALQRAGPDPVEPFGRTLGDDEQTLWLSHTHNYYWRLDFDLGADALDDAFTETFWRKSEDGSLVRNTRELDQEEALNIDRTGLQDWHVWDRAPARVDTSVDLPRGYRIDTSGGGHDFERLEVEDWSGDDLFVTVVNDCERFASQNSRFEPDCADDVADFANDESLLTTDLVLWKRVSFHHVPRNEDREHMHTHWDGFTLSPVNMDVERLEGGPIQVADADEASEGDDSGGLLGGTGWMLLGLIGAMVGVRRQTLGDCHPRSEPLQ